MKINQILQGINESALKDKADLEAKRKALQDMERQPGHDKEAIRQRKLDLEREARTKGLAEGAYDNASPMVKDAVKQDKIKSLKNLIAKAKEQGRQLKVQEYELELKKLNEVSLGDYRRKASLSKAGAQIDKVFGSPEKKEKADSIIAKRERGLDRADARGRANAEKLKQKAEQDRIASLRSAKDRLDDIKAELAELEAKFDSYYEYSDDHGEWTRQRELHRKIMAMKKHIADIEALDEADGNFGQPATMMKASPEAMDTANAIVQQQADKNVVSQAKIAGTVPNQGVSESDDDDDSDDNDDSDDYEDPEEAVYDEDWDEMIDRLKELAGKGPLVSIRGDDGITRNVPKKDLNK